MARIVVIEKGAGFAEIVKKVERNPPAALQRKAVARAAKRVEETTTAHYHNLLREVNRHLRPRGLSTAYGAPSPEAGGSVNIRYTRANGAVGHVHIRRPWTPLSEKYRARKPISRQFWYKHGRLADDISTRSFVLGKAGKTKAVPVPGATRAHKRGLINTRLRVFFPALPLEVMTQFVRETFLGRASVYRTFIPGRPKIRKTDPNRVVFPERHRPWIRELSAKLGEDLLKSLRKL